jgi:hypothetical protein
MTFPPRRPSRRVRLWAGATAAVVAGSLSLVACSADADDPAPASGETREPTPKPSPSTSDGPGEPTPSESPSEPTGTTVAVYFVGDGPGGRPVLFREFHRVTGDPLTEAARLVAGRGTPDDPDYRTLWPRIDLSVSATDGVLLVQIPTDAFTERPDGMTERDAKLALQQSLC